MVAFDCEVRRNFFSHTLYIMQKTAQFRTNLRRFPHKANIKAYKTPNLQLITSTKLIICAEIT